MPSLYIIRGVPGSGKTTLGNRLKAGGLVRYVVSADDFMVDDCGDYQFDPAKLKQCHDLCHIAAQNALRNRESVAVCNTFTRIWEMLPYVNMARAYDAALYVIRCEGDYGNVHGVPRAVVARMRARFEEWHG